MTAPKGKRVAAKAPMAARTTSQVTNSHPLSTAPSSPHPVNGKKNKKKKKGKGKSVAVAADFDEDEEEDDVPALEPNGTRGYEGSGQTRNARTGLSPELESVHLSTTASLSASVAAARRSNPAAAMAEAELLATADHLARSMETDPEGGVNDEYWATFPEHLRNFVRNTYSQLSSGGNEDEKTQAMYAIAQQIHSGVGVNLNGTATATTLTNAKGTTTTTRYSGSTATTTTTTTTATFPTSLPFDSSIFSDPAFTLAMEQAAAANGLHAPSDRGNLGGGDGVLVY